MASLTSILGDLPSSGNPYEYLEYRVARLILPELVPGAQALWMIDIGILGTQMIQSWSIATNSNPLSLTALVVVICLAFAFLAGRILHRDMYLYKKHRTGTGFVITPNSTVLFAFFATSFAIWTIPYVWCTSQAQKATTLRANDLRIQTGMLIPVSVLKVQIWTWVEID